MTDTVSAMVRAGRHRAARRRIPALRIGAVILVLAAAVVGAYLVTRSSGFDYRYATRRTENAGGGYAFSYPPTWKVTQDATAAKIVAPDGSVVVSLGRGVTGSVQSASAALVEEIKRAYRRVVVGGSEAEMIGGAPAITVSGTGRNEAGVSLRFVAIAIQGPGTRTFAITAFTAADADPNEVLPRLDEIVDSFRIT